MDFCSKVILGMSKFVSHRLWKTTSVYMNEWSLIWSLLFKIESLKQNR